MANLFENLLEVYGDRGVLELAEPLGYRLFPSRGLTCRDCLAFTNLAAEALIRELDLKKGERVVLCSGGPGDLLLTAAAVKAGGIAVPVHPRLPPQEMRYRVEGCGARLAVVDGRILAERPGLLECMPGVRGVMASGPAAESPGDHPSLDQALQESSGFFIPYTLKPSNAVGLFYTRMADGSLRAVIASNQGLLGPQRAWSLLFPVRAGDPGICALPLDSVSGFSAALLGLCMGLRLFLLPDAGPGGALAAIEESRPVAFLGTPALCAEMMEAREPGYDLASVRLWLVAGEGLPSGARDALRRLVSPRPWPPRPPGLVVEAYGAGGNATMLALKPTFSRLGWPHDCPGPTLPPNRVRVADGRGRRAKRGEEGELVIRGPAVTHGYWNDLEATFRAKRDGWLHTGLRAARKRFLVTLR